MVILLYRHNLGFEDLDVRFLSAPCLQDLELALQHRQEGLSDSAIGGGGAEELVTFWLVEESIVVGDGKDVGELSQTHAGIEQVLIADLVEMPEDGPNTHHALGQRERFPHDLHPIDLVLVVKRFHLLHLFFRLRQVGARLGECAAYAEKHFDPIVGWHTGSGRHVCFLWTELLLDDAAVVDGAFERAHHHHTEHEGQRDGDHHQYAAPDGSLFQAAPGFFFQSISVREKVVSQSRTDRGPNC